jgi:hypothetical protein
LGVVNIALGESSDPEQEVLSDVGTDDWQIGRISDALILLLAHLHPETWLTPDETAAIGNNVLNSVGEAPAAGNAAMRRNPDFWFGAQRMKWRHRFRRNP